MILALGTLLPSQKKKSIQHTICVPHVTVVNLISHRLILACSCTYTQRRAVTSQYRSETDSTTISQAMIWIARKPKRTFSATLGDEVSPGVNHSILDRH